MDITINETKNDEITINNFVDEEEKKWAKEFMRSFNLLRLKKEK